MCFYYDDCDEPKLWEQTIVIGRKQHKCESCRKEIPVGEQYISIFYILDGANRFRVCNRCCQDRVKIHRHELIPCRDGKARRIESSLQPLAHGVSNRVGRLRGYGNAIVPQVAAARKRGLDVITKRDGEDAIVIQVIGKFDWNTETGK